MLAPSRILGLGLAIALTPAGCSPSEERGRVVHVDRSDLPLTKATAAELERFADGDRLFEATLREADGLGPLYIRASCTACHRADGRGPGLVGKMAVVEEDRVTPSPDQSILRYGTAERPYVAARAKRAVTRPENAEQVRVTYRFPPAVFGRGYMEAIADEEIEKLEHAAKTRDDGIRGRIHRLCRGDEAPCAIGRFGLKARLSTLEEFTADAFQNDMGITSPARPHELPNPDAELDDGKPGVDVTTEIVAGVAEYVRLLELPARASTGARGGELFQGALCGACHVSSLRTRVDYPVSALAGVAAPVFTDFLLHDMGASLADGVVEGSAGSREWRTAPLIGLRFFSAYLHDGRAHTVEEAVLAHGGEGSEAEVSVHRFRALGPSDRDELLRFVAAL